MAQYEFMAILNPALGEETLNASIDGLKNAFKAVDANLQKEDIWWEKKLAYKIKGSENGYYILFTLELNGTHIKTLSTQFNLDKNIWRYMFVNLEA